jgi:hypothetical protein
MANSKAKPAPAAPAPVAARVPQYAAQANALPKGQRGVRRFTYPQRSVALAASGTLASTGKQATVAAYLAACAAANQPATYGGLHDICGSSARNAWRKGWVNPA